MDFDLPSKLRKALEREAKDANRTLNAHVVRKLESITPPLESMKPEAVRIGLPKLVAYLNRVPAVKVISSDCTPDSFWWVKLEMDITHTLAWNVVQELGYVLNYLSVEEKLPTVFMPVSPPPYMNGGPQQFLAWVIESKYNYIDPSWVASVLEGRLPRPVEDHTQWVEV
jgi:hypothetical protein